MQELLDSIHFDCYFKLFLFLLSKHNFLVIKLFCLLFVTNFNLLLMIACCCSIGCLYFGMLLGCFFGIVDERGIFNRLINFNRFNLKEEPSLLD